jgi:hypothetical protein
MAHVLRIDSSIRVEGPPRCGAKSEIEMKKLFLVYDRELGRDRRVLGVRRYIGTTDRNVVKIRTSR